ncbi:MAG: chorismate mutase [Chthoniobacterales bacterium]
MSDLTELRRKIDEIDSTLIDLLNQRAALALEVGKIKQTTGVPVYAPAREDQLLRGLVKKNKGPLTPEAIHAIYREIMSASLSLETDLVIACLGPETGITRQAAQQKFGSSVRYVFLPEISDVLTSVEKSKAHYAVVPIETSLEKPVRSTLDSLLEQKLFIVAQVLLRNSADGKPAGRFFIVGRKLNPPSESDQTSLCIRLHNQPGALVSALAPLSDSGINLVQILSWQDDTGKPAECFYLEIQGHAEDSAIHKTIETLRVRCDFLKVLGSYPKA